MRKGFGVSVILLTCGVAMLIFVLKVVIPAAENNARVCTLEVDAVVVDNKSSYDEDNGLYYKQIVEYVVGERKMTVNVGGCTSDPVETGTVIKLWVDPADPGRFTTTRDASGIGKASVAVPIGIIAIAVAGLIKTGMGRRKCIES